ncbi:MAG: hypothetical protein GY787_16440 [Alteromonadales bacterium]|nr:hypothetical protein [Alteromonadales bacterium]
MDNLFKKNLLTSIIVLSLTACGGGDETPKNITATFIDSAVAGLEYQCDVSTGTTNEDGEFTIVEGESCSFSINGFQIGTTDKITATNLIVTPYDTAENAAEAVKIASILQTIDADGDATNGINIIDFEIEIPSDIFETTDETEFIKTLATTLEISEADIITLAQAQDHLDENVTEKKGYHSIAVQEVIDDIIAISPTIETENYEEKLAEYKATLAAGDDSTNSDIEVLQSVIAITEVINKASILTRLDISVPNSPFSYTDMLPKLITFATQEQADNILNFEDDITGSSDDVAALLYDYALTLVTLSDKLKASFADENYIAIYSKDGDLQLNYQDAQIARMAALSVANQLSLIAAYDIGSDEYFIIKTETLKDIPVLKVNHSTGLTTTDTQDIETDSVTIHYDPKSYFEDEGTFKLRQDAKYLTTAKDALAQLTTVAKTVDLALLNPDATTDENEEITSQINKLYTHMHAADGKTSPLVTVLENTTVTVNLHAFYNLATGLDREDIDFDVDNMSVCYDANYNIDLSKIMGEPMCDYSGTNYKHGLYLSDSGDYGIHLRAMYADDNSEWKFSADSNLKDILLSCIETSEDGTSVDCMPE